MGALPLFDRDNLEPHFSRFEHRRRGRRAPRVVVGDSGPSPNFAGGPIDRWGRGAEALTPALRMEPLGTRIPFNPEISLSS